MKTGGALVVAAAVLLPPPAGAFGQPVQTTVKPRTGVHSRGVQVLAPGQAAVSDSTAVPVAVAPVAVTPVATQVAPRPVFVVAPVTHPVIKACDRPFARSELTLGASGFDHRLASALRAGAPVVVDVAEPYDQAAEPPADLSPWLKAARAGGGSVTVSPYCTAGRGIFHDWVEDVVAHVSGRIYRPARNYDVVLYADAARRKVTQVRFKPRPSVVAAN